MFIETLESEFEKYKAVHKYTVLKAKLIQYFSDLEDDQVNVPDFMRIGQRPEDKADAELRRLLCTPGGFREFNRLYEIAYEDLAQKGEF